MPQITLSGVTVSAPPDVTAPIIGSPTGAQTGVTTATGSVTTNENNGNLFSVTTTNATELEATVEAGNSQPVTQAGTQNIAVAGLTGGETYYHHFLHIDAAGNKSNVVSSNQFTTQTGDSTPPVISLIGDSTVNLVVGDSWSDPGATASDNVDGNITGDIVVSGDTVDLNTAATYTINYDVADAAGNNAVQVTRTVIVATSRSMSLSGVTVSAPALTGFSYTVPDSGEVDITFDSPLTGNLRYAYSTNEALADDKTDALNSGNQQTVVAAGQQTIQLTGLTPTDSLFFCAYLIYSGGESSLLTASGIQAAIQTTIDSVSTARLGETVTITTNGDVDLSAASTIVADVDGVALTGQANTTATAVDFTMPASGIDLDAQHSLTLTVDGIVGNSISIPVLLPVGWGYVTLASVDEDSHLFEYSGAGGNAIGASDLVVYQVLTTDNKGVSMDDTGLVTITGAGAGAVDQVFDWYYFDAQDSYAKSGTQTLTISAVGGDSEAPVISRLGSAVVTLQYGQTYNDAGATAFDAVDGDISGDIVTTNPVNTSQVGSYTVSYNVSDAAGNAAQEVTRTVNVVDTVAPVITLLGNATVDHPVQTAYSDAGATALDNADGNLTGDLDIVSTVNTNVPGSYQVRYNVSDSSGNAATQVTRTVNVVDTVAPVITLLGDETLTLQVGQIFTDPGATATDNVDGDLTGSIETNGLVNTNVEGTYVIAYDVSDLSGNAATTRYRTVEIIEATDIDPPVITLIGQNPVNLVQGDVYNDAGARADDAVDGNITSSIQTLNPVNTDIVGSYSVRYNVSDSSGNAAQEVTRTVIVSETADTTPPTISVQGASVVTVPFGQAYNDAGATAFDSVDGDVTANIVVSSSVNTSIAGTYTVRYNVVDSSGNAAQEQVRTVIVQSEADSQAPVITLNGDAYVETPLGQPYVDAGASASDNLDGDISNLISVSNSVNTSVPGTYTVVFNVIDSSGNTALPVVRVVVVVNDNVPSISVNGPSTLYVDQDSTFVDSGAYVTSVIDGPSTIYASESVDTAVLGVNSLSYSYTDSEGNVADTVYRTVIVRDPNQVVASIENPNSIIKRIIKRVS